MANERQIAANRRNAQKSTGPKTASGIKRASKNAYRHGLSLPMSSIGSEAQLKDLSRQFAGDASDAKILALAERAADAQLDLVRVRKAKTAMIERALMLGAAGARSHPELKELGHRIVQNGWRRKTQGASLPQPELLDSATPLPGGAHVYIRQQRNEEEERRFVNGVQHILPELTKICRYEKRAAGRRDRAIHEIASIKTANKKYCSSGPSPE
jgi:hypothetical protein